VLPSLMTLPGAMLVGILLPNLPMSAMEGYGLVKI
jgi:hypothetical protein